MTDQLKKTFKTSEGLYIAVISDIHLGHRRNHTRDIIKNLLLAFPDDAETAMLDIIFLAGDVFDSLLNLPEEVAIEIKFWIVKFLHTCKKHDVTVRVLEGTPRHDWKQSNLFLTMNSVAGIGANLQYVSTLSIEYIEQFGITVLYVPDEWNTSTEKTFSQVQDLLKAKGLDKVDYAIMHGQFEYQLPPHVPAPKHSSANYLSVVRHLIFIGHVHLFSTYLERIIAQGSFDRLSHNEEGPKGHVRAMIRKDGTHEVRFIENKGAKIFKTVNCNNMNAQECFEHLEREINGLPMGSYVRLQTNAGNPILRDMASVFRLFPLYSWSTNVIDEVVSVDDVPVVDVPEELLHAITLTKENIPELVVAKIVATGAPAEIVNAAMIILEEACNVSI